MNSEEIVKKWGDIGLLDGIENPDRKLELALTYEKAAQIFLIDTPIFSQGDFIITTTFPIIYRVIKAGGKITDVTDLIEKFKQFVEDNRESITELGFVNHIDIEAQMCRIFSEDYLDWLLENPQVGPIKYIPRHRL